MSSTEFALKRSFIFVSGCKGNYLGGRFIPFEEEYGRGKRVFLDGAHFTLNRKRCFYEILLIKKCLHGGGKRVCFVLFTGRLVGFSAGRETNQQKSSTPRGG